MSTNDFPSKDLRLPTPRPVRRRLPFPGGCQCLVLVPHTLIGFVLIALMLNGFFLAFLGQDIVAAVTDCREHKGKSVTYEISYAGELPDGHKVTGAITEFSPVNGTIAVRVLRMGPFTGSARSKSDAMTEFTGLVFGSIFWNGAIWGAFWIPLILPGRRQRALVIGGTPYLGKIVGRREVVRNKQNVKVLAYEFQYMNRKLEAEMDALSKDDFDRLVNGTEVTVLIGDDPLKGAIYEACQYEVVK